MPQELEPSNVARAAAKLRRLDKLLGQKDFDELNAKLSDGITEWEENFVANVKDYIDVKKKELTPKQIEHINSIYMKAFTLDLIEEYDEWKAFVNG